MLSVKFLFSRSGRGFILASSNPTLFPRIGWVDMKTSLSRVWLFTAFLIGAEAVQADQQWPPLDAPPRSSVQWVAQDMVNNGVPMRIQSFQATASVADVVSFYQQHWAGLSEAPPAVNKVGGWQVVGQKSGDYYLTVQVKPGTNSTAQGFLAASRIDGLMAGTNRTDTTFPRLSGSSVVSDVDANDDGKISKTLLSSNSYSLESNAEYYRSTLTTQGWELQQNARNAAGVAPARVLYFAKPGHACQQMVVVVAACFQLVCWSDCCSDSVAADRSSHGEVFARGILLNPVE